MDKLKRGIMVDGCWVRCAGCGLLVLSQADRKSFRASLHASGWSETSGKGWVCDRCTLDDNGSRLVGVVA